MWTGSEVAMLVIALCHCLLQLLHRYQQTIEK